MRKPADTGNRCFDQFWAAYPRKVGKEKAKRAFEKIQPSETELQQMLAELERQRKVYHWGKENWKFIPHLHISELHRRAAIPAAHSPMCQSVPTGTAQVVLYRRSDRMRQDTHLHRHCGRHDPERFFGAVHGVA